MIEVGAPEISDGLTSSTLISSLPLHAGVGRDDRVRRQDDEQAAPVALVRVSAERSP